MSVLVTFLARGLKGERMTSAASQRKVGVRKGTGAWRRTSLARDAGDVEHQRAGFLVVGPLGILGRVPGQGVERVERLRLDGLGAGGDEAWSGGHFRKQAIGTKTAVPRGERRPGLGIRRRPGRTLAPGGRVSLC